jgi:hypothetical protein
VRPTWASAALRVPAGSWDDLDGTGPLADFPPGFSLAIAASLRAAGESDGLSFGVSVGAGTLKEIYDGTIRPGRPGASWKDLLADVVGAAAGVLIVDALDR